MMFKQIIDAMSKPATQNSLDHAQQMMESTLNLTQIQMEVIKDLYEENSREYRNAVVSSSEPPEMAKSWPRFLSAATRANAEALALLMKNAQEYQSEMWQVMQRLNPEIAKTSSIANGGAALRAARAKKEA